MNQLRLSLAAPRAALTDAQKLDWLRLIRSEGVGPQTFLALVNRFGGAAGALEALPELARKRTGRSIRLCTREEAEREWAQGERLGITWVAKGEPTYPEALAVIDSAPPLLAVRGRVDALSAPMVAIVGSRNCSVLGGRLAERLAQGLGAHGFSIVSGLARGIDARAHEASLATGTVAVLAGGQDRIYPDEHRPLAERILEHGCVVSEMGLGYEPRGRDFPRRNRIVSGLCLGTVVVEAAERSGSLITAQFALDQGREVFAVPGSPLDPRAAGPNNLIRQRATLVRGAEDVLEVLLPMLTGREPQQAHMEDESSTSTPKPLYWDEWDFDGDSLDAPGPGTAAAEWPSEADEEAGEPPETLRQRLLECLGVTPAEVDDVARALGVTAREIQVLLFELELSGDVQRHGGGRVARRA